MGYWMLSVTLDEMDKVQSDASLNYGFGNELIIEYKFDQNPAAQARLTDPINGFGIRISSGQSLYLLYAHNLTGTLATKGTDVYPGFPISAVGLSGITNAAHLHLAAKIGLSGQVSITNDHSASGWSSGNLQVVDPTLFFYGG